MKLKNTEKFFDNGVVMQRTIEKAIPGLLFDSYDLFTESMAVHSMDELIERSGDGWRPIDGDAFYRALIINMYYDLRNHVEKK